MAGVYIHIPYCHSKCAYCDFFSTPRMAADSHRDYVDAVGREWLLRRGELHGDPVRTIYLGGGTPSILATDELAAIIEPLPLDNVEEITVEANPEDVGRRWVESMVALGVNRVSIGVQSLNDDELRVVGRRHSAAEALQAIATLHANGIANVSADLIYGLPGQSLESWRNSLNRLLDSGITHLSAYALSYEPGTRLTAMLRAGRIREAEQELSEAMYYQLCSITSQMGFVHYEISNFCLPGLHSRHNSAYWDFTPYLGLGPGAHSFDGVLRRVNPSRIGPYIAAMHDDGPSAPFYVVEEESVTDSANDAIITALRTRRGLSLDVLTAIGGSGFKAQLLRNAAGHLAAGRLTLSDGYLCIPEQHWLVADAILRDLILN